MRFMQTTPGITIPKFSRDPIGTEGEMTPGPDDFNPFEKERELRERVEMEQQRRALADDRLTSTVPNPRNPDLPPALINESPTSGDDPYVFDDVEDEVNRLSLPGLDNKPMFETGDMFKF